MTAMLRAFSITLFSIFFVACGGSGGSGPNTGTVTVAITDASIDDYDQAMLELSSVTLIGAGGQDETELLDGPETIDLLKLRNVSELLLRETVTARSISKIRLGVERITLNKLDLVGGIVETVSVDAPVPTRKIDLNPQGPMEVRAGEDLLIMIDFDLHNSLKINETGNGQIRFRPLVKIATGVSGLVRLYGTYTEDPDTGDFSICNLEPAYGADGIDPLDLCVALEEIDGTDGTHYFGADGKPLVPGEPNNPGDLMDTDVVSVYGTYMQNSDEPLLVADIIARAGSMPFELWYGFVTSAWDEITSQFELTQPTDDVLLPEEAMLVVLSEGAKVFNIDGEPLDPSAIEIAKLAEAQGTVTMGATGEPIFLQAFFAFVSDATGTDSTSGDILEIDTVENRISLMPDDPNGFECVLVTPTTEFYEIVTTDVSSLWEIDFVELMSGDSIDVSGDLVSDGTEGDCIQAITVIKEM